MKIPINPEHVRRRRQKYGPDGNFLTMPAPRPASTAENAAPTEQTDVESQEAAASTAIGSEEAGELVRK